MRPRLLLFASLVLAVSATGAQAKLEGRLRDNVIASGEASCLKKQLSSPENTGLSPKVLGAYCECKMTYIADNIEADQLVLIYSAIKDGAPKPRWLTDLFKSSTGYCLRNLSSYFAPR
jgi:hypothetical protein